jgi:hypothetical protein
LDLDANEILVAEFLSSRKFQCIRFSVDEIGRGPTPDFRVYQGAEFCFFCEVKSIDKDKWLDDQLDSVPPGTIAGGVRPDPVFNRLVSDIHQAIKQFDAVNPDTKHPNVLAFVNHDSICGIHDLYGVYTGNFLSDDGSKNSIYKKYSDGRIKKEKLKIHMFLWLNVLGNHHFMFTGVDTAHHNNLCKWLEKDPSNIKMY